MNQQLPQTPEEISLLVLERATTRLSLVAQLVRERELNSRLERLRLYQEYHELVNDWVERVEQAWPDLIQVHHDIYYIGDLQLCRKRNRNT
tara:strand:- start:437 stop:709 length:273 start_codon:yes stop_codon:yes gene_type:complete